MAEVAVPERGQAAEHTGGLFLFVAVAVTAHELVDAACGVDELLLAGEEGVRGACDFKLHERIGLAVDFDGFAGSDSRTGDEDFIVRHIFEYNFAVFGRMDVFFHCYCKFYNYQRKSLALVRRLFS